MSITAVTVVKPTMADAISGSSTNDSESASVPMRTAASTTPPIDIKGQCLANDNFLAAELSPGKISSSAPVTPFAPFVCQTSLAFSMQAWLLAGERTDLSSNDEMAIISCDGFWSIGIMGDGRVFATFNMLQPPPIEPPPTPPTRLTWINVRWRVVSDQPLTGGDWHFITLTMSSEGALTLYDGITQIGQTPSTKATLSLPSVPGMDPSETTGASATAPILLLEALKADTLYMASSLQLGSDKFIGLFYDAIFFSATIDPTQGVGSTIDLTVHDSQLPQSSTGSLHIACGTKGFDGYIKTSIDPINSIPGCFKSLSVQSVTSARSLANPGYINCGIRPPLESCCLEGWIKPYINPNDASILDFTIASSGFLDPSGEDNSRGWRLAWKVSRSREGDRTYCTSNIILDRFPNPLRDVSYGRKVMPVTGPNTISDISQWFHIALNGDENGFTVYLNGQALHTQSDSGFGADPLLGDVLSPYPLFLGAVATRNPNPVYGSSLPVSTASNFSGCMKAFRIWAEPLYAEDILDIFNLKSTLGDSLGELYMSIDFCDPKASDLTLKCPIQYLGQTSYQQCLRSSASRDDRLDQNSSNEQARIVTPASNASDLVHAITENMSLRPDLIAPGILFSAIHTEIISSLCKRSYNVDPLTQCVVCILKNYGTQIQSYLDRLVMATSTDGILGAALDLIYFSSQNGFIGNILSCFNMSRFGFVNLVRRLEPNISKTQLILELNSALSPIQAAISTYNSAIVAIPQPLTCIVTLATAGETMPNGTSTSDPLTDMLPITLFGDPITFQIKSNRPIAANEWMHIELISEPAGILQINPNILNFNSSITSRNVQISCVEYPLGGRASLLGVRGWFSENLAKFEVESSTSLQLIKPSVICAPTKAADLENCPIDMTLVFNGPSNIPMPRIQAMTWTDNGFVKTIPLLDPYHPTPDTVLPLGSNIDVTATRISESAAVSSSTSKTTTAQNKVVNATGIFSLDDDTVKMQQVLTVVDNYGHMFNVPITGPYKPQDTVNIYMSNGGYGDAFYVHFQRKELNYNGEYVVSEASMAIDGGSDPAFADSMWREIDPSHLPKNNVLDCMILTNANEYHASGLLWMCKQMLLGPPKRKSELGSIATQRLRGLSPYVTWIDASNSQKSGKDGDAANQLEDLCKTYKWINKVTPIELTQQGPTSLLKAGGLLRYIGPSKSSLENLETPDALEAVNRTSLIAEFSSLEYSSVQALWPGDACDTSTQPNIRAALGILKSRVDSPPIVMEDLQYKKYGKGDLPGEAHYLFLKVSNHASKETNSSEFFQAVTADHYFISGNGSKFKMLSRQCLQWILDGHHQKWQREREKGWPMLPCTIWINNPGFDDTWNDIVYRNAEQRIFVRNGDPEANSGHLFFQVVNGVMQTQPAVLPNVSNQDKDKLTVTKLVGGGKRSDPLSGFDDAFWQPIYISPTQQISDINILGKMDDIMKSNISRMYMAGVSCSDMVNFTESSSGTVSSDLDAILSQSTIIKATNIHYEFGPQDPNQTPYYPLTWLRYLSMTGDRTGATSPEILGLDNTGDYNEWIALVAIYCAASPTAQKFQRPSRIMFKSNKGFEYSTKGASEGDYLYAIFPAPPRSGLVGFRWESTDDCLNALGCIWRKMVLDSSL